MIDAPNPSPDPRGIETRTEFTAAIRELHHHSALTLREISDRIELSRQAINDYVKGKHLPRSNGRNIEPFMELLRTGYGVTDPDELEAWKAALRRVAARPGPRPTDEPTPYPGLQPFREEDRPWYFGRDDVTGAVRRIRDTTDPRTGTVAVGGIDGALWLWADPDLGGTPVAVEGSGGPIKHLAFSPDGDRVAVADFEGTAWIHDVASGTETARIDASSNRLMTVAFSPEGDVLATGDTSGAVKLWELGEEPTLAGELGGPSNWLYSLVFLPGTSFLAAAASDGLWLWNRDSDAEPIHSLEVTPGSPLYTVRYAPDGDLLATGGFDLTVRLWDTPDGRPRQLGEPLTGPEQLIIWTTFDPTGTLLAAGSADGHVYLWDVTDPTAPQELPALEGDGARIAVVDFSPDGEMLAAASFDGTVIIWNKEDPRNPRRYANLSGTDGGLRAVDFDADGSTVAAAGDDPGARLWTTDPEAAAETICAAVGSPITPEEWRRHIPGVPYQNPC